jgi:hypothetical protein
MLFEGHLGIFAINVFYNDPDSGSWTLLRRHAKVPMVQISTSGLFYFWRYTMWRIGVTPICHT